MGKFGGFRSPEHEEKCRTAAAPVQRGGPEAPLCGARSRKGEICSGLPIKEGKGRCLRHAGPHAARAFRERQLRDFRAGKISADDWNKCEAKRAANRLGWEWKKNPWYVGRTIDQGDSEGAFVASAVGLGVNVTTLAPAVADWLRWRYRRTQIDQSDAGAWEKVVWDTLPARIAKAGPKPKTQDALDVDASKPAWDLGAASDDRAGGYSKRSLPDVPKAPKTIRGKGYGRRGRPRIQDANENEMEQLSAVYRLNHDVLGPMLANCSSEGDKLAVLRSLRDYTDNPKNPMLIAQWSAHVRRFART